MAESVHEKVLESTLQRFVNENSGSVECAVCLQTCIHPAELPCGHIFCYLCIKGIVNQGRRCAMCRQDIPVDYLDKPRLLKPVDLENGTQGFDDGHLWFYEGHNGWWQYDERTSTELENAYQKGERCCELLIAGLLYIVDFDGMLQYRRNDPCRRRRIKRDLASISKKGVAGLKVSKDCNNVSSTSSELVSNMLTPDMQGLHISNHSRNPPNDNRGVGLANPSSNNFNPNNLEPIQRERTVRERNSFLTLPQSSNQTELSNNLNVAPSNESDDPFYSRNSELDSMIHNTLDWTIQQIESLNLELSNDYENLFRDVNRYGQLNKALNVNGSGRLANNCAYQYPSSYSRLNQSLENELDSINRITNLPQLNHSEGNISTLENWQSTSNNMDNVSTNSNDGISDRSLLFPSIVPLSQAPRLRRASRINTRRVPSRTTTIKNQDTTF